MVINENHFVYKTIWTKANTYDLDEEIFRRWPAERPGNEKYWSRLHWTKRWSVYFQTFNEVLQILSSWYRVIPCGSCHEYKKCWDQIVPNSCTESLNNLTCSHPEWSAILYNLERLTVLFWLVNKCLEEEESLNDITKLRVLNITMYDQDWKILHPYFQKKEWEEAERWEIITQQQKIAYSIYPIIERCKKRTQNIIWAKSLTRHYRENAQQTILPRFYNKVKIAYPDTFYSLFNSW